MVADSGDPAVPGATGRAGTVRGVADPRWAWAAAGSGAWIVGGTFLVARALERGDTTDAGMSPYHVVAYAGLRALAATSVWLAVRARRQGRGWGAAFLSKKPRWSSSLRSFQRARRLSY